MNGMEWKNLEAGPDENADVYCCLAAPIVDCGQFILCLCKGASDLPDLVWPGTADSAGHTGSFGYYAPIGLVFPWIAIECSLRYFFFSFSFYGRFATSGCTVRVLVL